ncbi:MAG: RNA 2',3'-cyclic phosphodiesterase [Eggerthellaceae bacterium]|nr:RNA 2',3'-cyclic phosphodiesterase [Eggerthellaceae bacterium]
MRLFIATELPQEMLDALAETQAELRACVSGRYVGADSFHVTLAFLGEVEAWRVNELADILDDACSGHAAFESCLGELGNFGRASKATLWQGFTDKKPFAELAQSVRRELAHAGFDFDDKGFLPHITLMRKLDLSSGVLPMPHVARGTIDTVSLFESDLSGDYPAYTALHRTFLA